MGKKLTENQLGDLITKGKTTTIKGISHPSSAEKISGKFILNKGFNVEFEN